MDRATKLVINTKERLDHGTDCSCFPWDFQTDLWS